MFLPLGQDLSFLLFVLLYSMPNLATDIAMYLLVFPHNLTMCMPNWLKVVSGRSTKPLWSKIAAIVSKWLKITR